MNKMGGDLYEKSLQDSEGRGSTQKIMWATRWAQKPVINGVKYIPSITRTVDGSEIRRTNHRLDGAKAHVK